MRSGAAVLRWALDRFPAERLVLASSFGAEDMVLLDLCAAIGRFPRVVTLDTGRLPQATYDLMEDARRRYGLRLEVFSPEAQEVERLVSEHGPNLFYESVELRRLCCRARKVEPLERALAGCEAWITGLRAGQSAERARTRAVVRDEGGRLKVCPLHDWTSEKVWRYVSERGVPVNRLHREGYPSIGCAPCTRPVRPGEDERAGRWWWERGGAKECGLHR